MDSKNNIKVMFCKYCGTNVGDSNIYCTNCGKPKVPESSTDSIKKVGSTNIDLWQKLFYPQTFTSYFYSGLVAGVVAFTGLAVLSGELEHPIVILLCVYWLVITLNYLRRQLKDVSRKGFFNRIFQIILAISIIWIFSQILILIGDYSRESSNQKVINDANINEYQTSANCNENATLEDIRKKTYVVISDNGHGSGFAINQDGFILTNYHVIEGSKKVLILINGSIQNATIYARYPDYDLAVLKINHTLEPVSFFSEKGLKTAETLYAIGFPDDPTGDPSITRGIYSRLISDDDMDIIQTDAPINPGNSGGPLVGACGVIGINTAKLNWINESPVDGMGYAISTDTIRSVIYENE